MLCISGFVDDVMFSHNGPYVRVALAMCITYVSAVLEEVVTNFQRNCQAAPRCLTSSSSSSFFFFFFFFFFFLPYVVRLHTDKDVSDDDMSDASTGRWPAARGIKAEGEVCFL